MKTVIQLYENLKQKVHFLYTQLQLDRQEKTKGRKLALPITDSITLSIFKQKNHSATKKSVYETFDPPCSYKTLVVNMNRFVRLAMILLTFLLNLNRASAHPVKHTDATDSPVCTNQRAKHHKTMQGLASWKKTGKGSFYGLKLYSTTDLKRKLLSFRFTSGKVDDRKTFMRVNKGLMGIFVADAGYISQKLQHEFYIEHKRILFVRPRVNMKKLITPFQYHLYTTRMLIELILQESQTVLRTRFVTASFHEWLSCQRYLLTACLPDCVIHFVNDTRCTLCSSVPRFGHHQG